MWRNGTNKSKLNVSVLVRRDTVTGYLVPDVLGPTWLPYLQGSIFPKPKLHARRNKEQIKFGELLLLSGTKFLSSNCQLKTKIYRTIIVLIILYCGCWTWSLTSREEHRSRVFENRMLRRIFVSERKEVTVGWRKLHNDELHFLLPTKQREWDGWGMWHFAGKRGRATAYLMGKPKDVGADG